MAEVLERHMDGRTFVIGDRISIADCVTVYVIDWGNEVGLIDGFPNLKAYLERMYARAKAPPRIADALASLEAAG